MLRHRGRHAKGRSPLRRPLEGKRPVFARAWWWLAAVFLVKIGVLLQLRGHPLLQPDAGLDATFFVHQARAILEGNVALGPGLFPAPPLYLYWLALLLEVSGGSFTAIRVAQIALGTAAVGLLFKAAAAWFGRRASFVTAILAALTGVFTLHEVQLIPSALTPFLTASALAALVTGLRTSSLRWLGLAGLLFGVGALNEPLLLAGLAGVAATLSLRREWKPAVVLAAGTLAALLPLLLRNVVVAGDASPLSSHGGVSFYVGNNPSADGTFRPPAGLSLAVSARRDEARRTAELAAGRPLDDGDVSAYFYAAGSHWLRSHPAEALRLFARKLALVFNSAQLPENDSDAYFLRHGGVMLRLLAVGPWLILPIGIAGLFIQPAPPSRPTDLRTWLAFVPSYALGLAAFYVSSAHRLPILAALCVTSGGAIDAGWARLKDWRSRSGDTPMHGPDRRHVAVVLALIVVCAAATNWPVAADDGSEEAQTRMALWLVGQGRYGEADARLAELEPASREPAALHYRVGRALLARNQLEPAINHLQRSLTIDPTRTDAEQALGQALLMSGRVAESIPHLRRAVEAGVRADVAGYDLARALGLTGDRAGALRALQAVRPSNPDDGRVWYELAEVAARLQAPRLAEAYYRRALQQKNPPADSHQQLGLTLASLGRFEDAAAELELALRSDPQNPVNHLNLAVSLAELGRVDEARAHANDALRLRPDYDKARELLAAISKAPARR